MITLRLISLSMLLVSFVLWSRDSLADGQGAAWHVYAPNQKPPVFIAPAGIAVGANGHVYVADSASGTVQVLSSTGEALAQWGKSVPLKAPIGIAAVQDGTVLVADAGIGRLVRFSPDGGVVAVMRLPGVIQIAVGPSGDVYGVQATKQGDRLLQVTATGAVRRTWHTHVRHIPRSSNVCLSGSNRSCVGTVRSGPSNIAVDAHGTVYVLLFGQADVAQNEGAAFFVLQTFSPQGRFLHESLLGVDSQEVDLPSRGLRAGVTALAIGPQGEIFTAGGDGLAEVSASGRVYRHQHLAGCKGAKPWGYGSENLTVDRHGTVFVIRGYERTIQTFSKSLRPLAVWGTCQSHAFTNLQGQGRRSLLSFHMR